MKCDAVVIGSGAAGAVVAAELAQQGLAVIVLEEGPRISTRNGNVAHAVHNYYRNAGALATVGEPPMTVQVGRAVGGSTIVNGGTCFRTPQSVLHGWSELCEDAFTPQEMDPWFDKVERELHVSRVPEALAFEGERMILHAAKARGDHADYVERNALACQGTQLCAFVCPTGAKQSVEQAVLPRAEKHGARVLADTKADRVLIQNDKVRGVEAHHKGERITIEAPLVALCAGAMHSPGILRRSVSSRVAGQSLFLHPGAHVIGFVDEPFATRRGPIQSIYVKGKTDRYVIYGMNYPPEIFGVVTLDHGVGMKNLTRHKHAIMLAVMGSDHRSRGRVMEIGGEPVPFYSLHQSDAESVALGVAHAADLLFDVGARDVCTTIRGYSPMHSRADVERLRNAKVPRGQMVLGSVHPMGTLPMGIDPDTSVVDPNLKVHGVEGLYIPDASFFPSSLGVNPQITIMAFAMRTAATRMTRA